MARTISIGVQDFVKVRENNFFFVDKSDFIRQWWESADDITLITRPRRFGKTLNMRMTESFFSPMYKGRDLFDGLNIRQWERYDELRGQVPVVFVSFAGIKTSNVEDMKYRIKYEIFRTYDRLKPCLEGTVLDDADWKIIRSADRDMPDAQAQVAINDLCCILEKAYNVKPIVIIDEYDTPMVEAWMARYWDEASEFMRGFFSSTFKSNPSLGRGLITGITRISKESLFSDLNNLTVVSTTTKKYENCFGFTEEEVFAALDEQGLGSHRQKVKRWYDGYKFGNADSIYNPWSMTYFMDAKGEYDTYWGNTAGTGLLDRLIGRGSADIKNKLEDLLQGKTIKTQLDEQVVFSQIDDSDNAVWSLLLVTGYLTYDRAEAPGEDMDLEYTLRLVNFESFKIFCGLVKGWFARSSGDYGRFIKMMLADDLRSMNDYMQLVVKKSFSFFDVGENAAESFYHAFVLGMVVDLQDTYTVESNKESGFGRYDVCICPKDVNTGLNGYVLEFKLYNPRDDENGLEDTVARALEQINQKGYATEMEQRGMHTDRIRKYGFGFDREKVLIGRETL